MREFYGQNDKKGKTEIAQKQTCSNQGKTIHPCNPNDYQDGMN